MAVKMGLFWAGPLEAGQVGLWISHLSNGSLPPKEEFTKPIPEESFCPLPFLSGWGKSILMKSFRLIFYAQLALFHAYDSYQVNPQMFQRCLGWQTKLPERICPARVTQSGGLRLDWISSFLNQYSILSHCIFFS